MQSSGADRTNFDVIVLGVGGMGSATCRELASRGISVLGLDQFPFVHDRGSSHGESRIIRKAYFEHPNYVPLLHRAYEKWHELEHSTGQELFVPTGLVLSGPSQGETIRGARTSAKQHHLTIENYTAKEGRRRFPGLSFPEEHDVVFEPGAGTLKVDDCVRAQVNEAIRLGATLRGNEPVVDWKSDRDEVRITTTVATYSAKKLIITAGAWANNNLPNLGSGFRVLRKFVGWFPIQRDDYLASKGFPTYFFELPHGTFYGFPSFDGQTVKVAEHSGGEEVTNPTNVNRDLLPEDPTRLEAFLSSCLPQVTPRIARHSVCLYTMTPDQHFVIDSHPHHTNVIFAAGFSGHGFKFCPVIGEVLADLAQTGKTEHPISFLSLNRDPV